MRIDDHTMFEVLEPYVGSEGATVCLETFRRREEESRSRRVRDSGSVLVETLRSLLLPIAPAAAVERLIAEISEPSE